MATITPTTSERLAGQEVTRTIYSGGRWRDAESDQATTVVDPATERVLGRYRFATNGQVEEAIGFARSAFDGRAWRSVGPLERSGLLHAFCDLFEAHQDEFIDLITAETGSPIPLSRVGQVQSAQECFRWFAEAARTGPAGGYERGLPLHYDPVTTASLLRLEPAGVVAAITAYNYPLLLLARKLGGILASGCTTVVMPSERAPIATLRVFELLGQVGYPTGVVNLVIGGRDAGLTLTTSPGVDMVTFTGSVAVGRDVMRQGASTTKRVVLELGGKSPTIVLDGADLDKAVPWSINRFTVAAGQGCGCTTRTLVQRSVYEEYADRSRRFIESLRVGNPRAEGTDVGPLIRAEHRDRVESYVERALQTGGRILAGGGRPSENTGYYMNPVYVEGVSNDSEIAQNELFGPVGVLLPFDTAEEAVRIANQTRFGLYAAVFGRNAETIEIAKELSAGTVVLNGGGRLRPDVPWGGYRDSGNGREAGDEGFREFFEAKHIQWVV